MPSAFEIDPLGWHALARRAKSPNFDCRPADQKIELIVIHAISLPPGQFGGSGVEQLFANTIVASDHPYYAEIAGLRVSAHFFIRRNGQLLQFVSCLDRAWHAGVSVWKGRERCNDFSIGIELEGDDFCAFDDRQYEVLNPLIKSLCEVYPVTEVVGHNDISPGRKTDPGPCFDWDRLKNA